MTLEYARAPDRPDALDHFKKDDIGAFLEEIRHLSGRDQIIIARARDAVPEHIQPGSLSYVAFTWVWLIDELIRVRSALVTSPSSSG